MLIAVGQRFAVNGCLSGCSLRRELIRSTNCMLTSAGVFDRVHSSTIRNTHTRTRGKNVRTAWRWRTTSTGNVASVASGVDADSAVFVGRGENANADSDRMDGHIDFTHRQSALLNYFNSFRFPTRLLQTLDSMVAVK